MSLILEALKKLERERKTPERGFLITTRAVWPSAGARPLPYVLAGAALLGVGAFGTWLVLDGSHRPPQAAAAAPLPTATPRAAAPMAGPTAPLPILLPAPAPRPSQEPRRPVATRPPVAKEVPSPEAPAAAELRLEAVSRRDGQPIAVLSGRLIHEGDAFDNVRVIRIGETEVEIEVDGQRRVISF